MPIPINENIPIGICQCGCGLPTTPAPQTHKKKGWVKGEPRRFLPMHGVGKSFQTPRERLERLVEKTDGCWLWKGSFTDAGYGQFTIKRTNMLAHRAAYILLVADIPKDLVVCHSCDNKRCVRPDHLFLGTYKDNMQDCLSKDRFAVGERHGKAKFTATDVLEIRRLSAVDGLSSRAIARRFSVSKSTILAIVNRETWRSV